MSASIALRDDYDSLELRALAKRSRDPRQVRRLLALAAAYDGMTRPVLWAVPIRLTQTPTTCRLRS